MADAYLLIGEITKPQGVRGELKVRPITCDPERFYDLDSVFLMKDGTYVPCGVAVRSASDEAVYLRMDGVETRDDAEKMRGTMLYIDRAHAVRLGKDANFVVDLIGCDVTDTEGTAYGKLTDVMQPGGNDVYVLQGPLGEVLVPALKSVVLKVDIEKKTMLLDAVRVRETAVFSDSEIVR